MTTNDTEIAIPLPADLRASDLFGQTRSAMVLTGAGLGWMVSGLSALGDVPMALLLVVLATAALLLLGGWTVRRLTPGIMEPPWSPKVRRGFWLAVGGEVVAILVIVSCASLLHKWDWILPLMALAVGLHFLPLAHLFRRPLLYVTGAALCLICIATIAFVPPHLGVRHLQGWLLAAGLGSGAVLWFSALWMLVQSWTGLREYSRGRREWKARH